MSRRRVFRSLLGLVFLVNLASVVFAPLLEPLMATFAVGPGAAGIVATLVWLGSAAPRIPVGYLLTRIPRRHVILVAGAVLAVSAGGAAFAPSIEFVALGAFLMGLSSGAYFIAANPLLSELYPERVGRIIGTHHTVGQLAAIVAAPFVGATLLLGGYRTVFLTIATGAIVATIALFFTARATDFPAAGAADRDLMGAARSQWRLIAFGVLVIGTASLVWNGVFNFYVTYLTFDKGLRPSMARNALTVAFAAGVPAFLVGGRLVDRFPDVPLLLMFVGGFVLTLLALTSVGGLVAILGVSAAIGYVYHSLPLVIDTFILRVLPDHHRASAYSIYSGGMMLVTATGSSVVGLLREAGIGFNAIFGGFAVGLGAIAFTLAVLHAAGRLPLEG